MRIISTKQNTNPWHDIVVRQHFRTNNFAGNSNRFIDARSFDRGQCCSGRPPLKVPRQISMGEYKIPNIAEGTYKIKEYLT